jgi:hypothetical protein
MILAASLQDAWTALANLAPARGTVAGYTGTARLEAVDDDTHTVWLRLQGAGPAGPVTAMVAARLEAAGAATRLHVDAPAEHELVTRTLAAALAPPAPAPAAARHGRRLVAAGVVAAGVAVAVARRRR